MPPSPHRMPKKEFPHQIIGGKFAGRLSNESNRRLLTRPSVASLLTLEPAGADKEGRYALLRGEVQMGKPEESQSSFEGKLQAVLTYGPGFLQGQIRPCRHRGGISLPTAKPAAHADGCGDRVQSGVTANALPSTSFLVRSGARD